MLVGQPQRIDRRIVFVPETYAVVEGPNPQHEGDPFGILHLYGHFVVAVPDLLVFAPGLRPGFIVLRAGDFGDGESRCEVCFVGFEPELRCGDPLSPSTSICRVGIPASFSVTEVRIRPSGEVTAVSVEQEISEIAAAMAARRKRFCFIVRQVGV